MNCVCTDLRYYAAVYAYKQFQKENSADTKHPSHLMLTYDCTESQGYFNVLPLLQIFDDNFAKREINQFTVKC